MVKTQKFQKKYKFSKKSDDSVIKKEKSRKKNNNFQNVCKLQESDEIQSDLKVQQILMKTLTPPHFKEISRIFLWKSWNLVNFTKTIYFRIVWKFSKFDGKDKKTANFKEIQSFQRIVIMHANICRSWLKIELRYQSFLDQFEAVWGSWNFFRFQHMFRAGKFVEFQEIFNILKLRSKKLYFQRLASFRIFVGISWKVDSEKGQTLKFLKGYETFPVTFYFFCTQFAFCGQ